jgi:putative aldouronate transport system permease protein
MKLTTERAKIKIETPSSPWMKTGIFDVINYLILTLISIATLFPFYNSVVLSFNNGKDALLGGIYFWPRVFSLDNYKHVLSNSTILNAYLVTISRTVLATVLCLFVTSLFGYAASKRYLKFRKLYMTIILISMYFHGGLIPSFLLIRNLGLYNNFLVYVIPAAFSAFYAQIFIAFFRGIPEALDESAKIDGANEWTIYFKIILPLSKPVLAAVGLFVAIGQWNAWYDNMLYVKKPELTTLSFQFVKMILAQQYLENLAETAGGAEMERMKGLSSIALQLASMVIATVPIMIIYPFAQRYFVNGIMIGSVKG